MIGSVTPGTNDLARAGRFYDAIAAEMGVGRFMEGEANIAWGVAGGGAGVAVVKPFDGKAASVGNGAMVALEAKDSAQVDRIHAIALANGGSDEGAPGERGGGFYAAYFRGPDGNKLNASACRARTVSEAGLPLGSRPIHLGLGASAEPQPEFPRNEVAMNWYMDYARRHEADGFDARLVASYTFSESWPMWEMHPNGAEVVICTSGSMTLHQQLADGSEATVTLEPGSYAINPPGAWHTSDIHGQATAVFIIAGIGTQHRPR